MKNFQVSQFPHFFLVGVDHSSASLEIREKFSLGNEQSKQLIADYKKLGGDGILIVSTCNRTEIYAFASCPRDVIDLFCKHTGNDHELFYQHQNILQNRETINHLFEVGGGLHSKILGDFEIIGQIKKAFQFSKKHDAHNAFLERLVNSCIQASKRVKNETQLSTGAASVAFAAVLQVKKFIENNPNPKIALVGTGKIGRTACENLINQTGIRDITLINRTDEKAERLAGHYNVQQTAYENLGETLNEADVVLTATGSEQPTVLPEHFTTAKKRLLLDLSVPRNISAELYNDESLQVTDVDKLSELTGESLERRKAEVPKTRQIIDEVTSEFYQWLESRKVAPTLQAVRAKMDDWTEKEVQNLLKKNPEMEAEHARELAGQLLKRITGQFARKLKNGSDLNGDLRTIHHIFELEENN